MIAFVAPQGALATVPSAQGTLIVVRFVQSEKALEAILFGIPLNVSVCRLVQPLNADLPILVIPFGRELRARWVQPLNA